jgi:hypothetical protein
MAWNLKRMFALGLAAYEQTQPASAWQRVPLAPWAVPKQAQRVQALTFDAARGARAFAASGRETEPDRLLLVRLGQS